MKPDKGAYRACSADDLRSATEPELPRRALVTRVASELATARRIGGRAVRAIRLHELGALCHRHHRISSSAVPTSKPDPRPPNRT